MNENFKKIDKTGKNILNKCVEKLCLISMAALFALTTHIFDVNAAVKTEKANSHNKNTSSIVKSVKKWGKYALAVPAIFFGGYFVRKMINNHRQLNQKFDQKFNLRYCVLINGGDLYYEKDNEENEIGFTFLPNKGSIAPNFSEKIKQLNNSNNPWIEITATDKEVENIETSYMVKVHLGTTRSTINFYPIDLKNFYLFGEGSDFFKELFNVFQNTELKKSNSKKFENGSLVQLSTMPAQQEFRKLIIVAGWNVSKKTCTMQD